MDITSAVQRITDRWFLSEPLLFGAFCAHQLIPNRSMQCAMRSGQRRIEYNPDWLEELKEIEISELLRREVIRIILKHPYERQPVNAIPEILYAASNVTIFEHSGTSITPQLWEEIDWPRGKSFEEYYNFLSHVLPPQPNRFGVTANDDNDSSEDDTNSSDSGQSERQSSDNGKESRSGNSDASDEEQDSSEESGSDSTDDESSSKNSGQSKSSSGKNDKESRSGDSDASDEERDGSGGGSRSEKGKSDNDSSEIYDCEISQEITPPCPKSLREIYDNGIDATELWGEDGLQFDYINGLIENAMLTSSWGSMPGNLKDLMKASTIKSENIRRRLDMFRTSIISTNRRLTRMRPSRRYGWMQMGVLHPYVSHLLIAVDTSGSIIGEDLKRFFGVVNSFFTYGIPHIDVIQFDCALHFPLLSLDKVTRRIELRGGGGTNFQPAVNYFTEHNEYDGMLVFTDGYAPKPTVPPNRKILWVLKDLSCYNEFEMTPKVYL